jgi:hypothetical protein
MKSASLTTDVHPGKPRGSWRSWSSANPCPVCSGHLYAGRSADQCRGGLFAHAPVRVWCSTQPSPWPSATGKSWRWELARPYAWQEEPERERRTGWGAPCRGPLPADLEAERGWRLAGTYAYYGGEGEYAYEVRRFDWDAAQGPCPRPYLKTYRPGRRAPDGAARISWGLPASERIPYSLPRLQRAIAAGLPVFIVEGEKSADAVNGLDPRLECHAATTLPGGSAQWSAAPGAHRWFDGAHDVTVVVDRDTAGEGWARDVVASLARVGITPRLVRSRTTAPGDDVVDHLAAGHALAELEKFTLT